MGRHPMRGRKMSSILAATMPRWQNLPIPSDPDVVRSHLLQLGNPWHPRKARLYQQTPEYAEYEVRLSAWQKELVQWENETARLKLSCFSEHFRCDVQLAVELVSLAIGAQLDMIPYDNG